MKQFEEFCNGTWLLAEGIWMGPVETGAEQRAIIESDVPHLEWLCEVQPWKYRVKP